MKKINIAIVLTTISIGSFAEPTFNTKIPQPDFISVDWDGDGINNKDDTDDDNDGIDDNVDSNQFDRANGGGRKPSGGAKIEYLDKFVLGGVNYDYENIFLYKGGTKLIVGMPNYSGQGGIIQDFDISGLNLNKTFEVSGNGGANEQVGKNLNVSKTGTRFITVSRKNVNGSWEHGIGTYKASGSSFVEDGFESNVPWGRTVSMSMNGNYLVSSQDGKMSSFYKYNNAGSWISKGYSNSLYAAEMGNSNWDYGSSMLISDDGKSLIANSYNGNNPYKYLGGYLSLAYKASVNTNGAFNNSVHFANPDNSNLGNSNLGRNRILETETEIFVSANYDLQSSQDEYNQAAGYTGGRSGAIYVYNKNGSFVTKIKTKNGLESANFGIAFGVSENGDYVVATQRDPDNIDNLIVFKRNEVNYEEIATSKNIDNEEIKTNLRYLGSNNGVDISNDGLISFGLRGSLYLLQVK
jgi:hypothetical protein